MNKYVICWAVCVWVGGTFGNEFLAIELGELVSAGWALETHFVVLFFHPIVE